MSFYNKYFVKTYDQAQFREIYIFYQEKQK